MTANAPILYVSNPFEPFDVDTWAENGAGSTIREWVEEEVGEFELPTLCILNGAPLLREDWDHKIVEGDVVTFVTLPGDPLTIIIAVVVAIITIAVTLLLAPKIPGELGDSDPAYSLKGQSNRVRLGEPIEVAYGKTVMWPSYAARPYNQYIGNEQFQYSLFCLGQGKFTIHETYIEDTPFSSFDDVEFEVIQPGGNVTLFPDNVISSVEVSNVELLGSNEVGYPTDGWFGPFVANPAGTLTTLLQIDIVFPQGLYSLDEGSRKNASAEYQISYQEVDDTGTPQGSFVDEASVVVTRRTGTPQRFTVEIPVSAARYQVRVRRVGTRSTSASVANKMNWEALRAFLPDTKDYGDVTLLATKIKATNQINNNSRSRVRVDATRWVPVWNGATFTETATRNPVWAFVDILRADYGGRLLASFIRLDDLLTMADDADTRGDSFDFIYDRRSTVWEAAKSCLRVMRSVPMLFGSQVSAVRDGPKTVYSGVFTKENIVPGSFKWDLRLVDNEEYDHVIVEYTDPNDGLAQEVVCRLPTDNENYPETIKLLGITDRDQAYREGMFYRATQRYNRETITFRTGMEGYIPAWGDLVKVAYDVPRWGFGGFIVDHDGAKKLTLSDPVGLVTGTGLGDADNYIGVRDVDGSMLGPYLIDKTFTEEESPGVVDRRIISLVADLPAPAVAALNLTDPNREPTYFVLGVGENVGKDCKVSDLRPAGDGEVEVTVVNYSPRAYSFDSSTAPPEDSVTLPPKIPAAPAVAELSVIVVADRDDVVLVTWSPSFGARSYILQESGDGSAGSWTEVIQTTGTSYLLPITAGVLYLRVAGVNESVGPWATWDGTVGVPANAPPAPTLAADSQSVWEGLTLSATWEPFPVSGAQSFKLKVYDTTDLVTPIATLTTPTALTLSYTADDMDTDLGPDNTVRDVTLAVVAVNAAGESNETTRQLVNAPPDQITAGLTALYNSDTATDALYDLSWTYTPPADAKEFQVHGSSTLGFTPSPATLLATVLVNSAQIPVPLTAPPASTHAAFYWRVVCIDRWGNDVTVAANVNFSAEQTIPAKP